MVSLFFVISLITMGLLCAKGNEALEKGEKDKIETWCSFIACNMLIAFIFLIWIIRLIFAVGMGYTIDDKIAMYEAENEAIEASIDVTVKNYMDFETRTYGELKDKDAINFVSLFPELKSDTLVQRQIEVYISNNDVIKKLREEKIELSKSKWKLYFGR